jgi:sugar phosphate isomerase/epimerase
VNNPISQPGIQNSPLDSGMTNLLSFNAATKTSIAPLRLSLSQLTTLRWPMTEEVVQLKQAGFDAIGLWRPKLSQFGEARAAEALTRARLQVSSLSFAGGFTGGCGLGYLEAIEDGRLAIEEARTVGAKTLIVVGGSANGHTVRHSHRMVKDGLCQLADSAERAQVTLSVLPMHPVFQKRWTFLNSLDQTLDLLAQVDHPSVGLAFDAYHLWKEPRLIERIPELVPVTNIVQVSDSNPTPVSEQDRLLPGQGVIPLTELIQAFQSAGYAGYFDIQVWSGNVWRSNYSHLIEQTHATVKEMSLVAAT